MSPLIDLIPIDAEAPPLSRFAVPFKVLGMAVDVRNPCLIENLGASLRRMKAADPVLGISFQSGGTWHRRDN
jgi:hypothetical protein